MPTFGNTTDLPFNDFLHGAGNITSAIFTAPEDGTITKMFVRIRSEAVSDNNLAVGIYDNPSGADVENLVRSPDILSFGTSENDLEFNINKSMTSGNKLVCAIQGEEGYYFYYDSATAGYMFLNNHAFDDFPATYTGEIFDATIQIALEYVTAAGIKKTLLLTGVGH